MKKKLKRILLVDDDKSFRETISDSLSEEGYDVIEAENGKEAVGILDVRKNIDLVLSDIRMPKMHGIELFHHVKRSYSELPFVMMTGFSELIEVKEAFDLGVTDFLSKPFDEDRLLESIESALANDNQGNAESELMDGEYSALAIEHFAKGSQIQFPIYLELKKGKLLKIANEGEDLSEDRIERFKEKGVNELFLKKDDMSAYLSISDRISSTIVSSTQIDEGRKQKFIQQSGDILIDFISRYSVDEKIADLLCNNIKNCLEILSKTQDPFNLLVKLGSEQSVLYAHSLSVSFVAQLIAKGRGWINSDKMNNLLIKSAIFHDIGLSKVPESIYCKSELLMSEGEFKQYKGHADEGADMLAEMEGIEEEVITIIRQHHEYSVVEGLSKKTRKSKIHPLTRVIALADDFCALTDERYRGNKKGSIIGIMSELEKNHFAYELENIQALYRVMGMSK